MTAPGHSAPNSKTSAAAAFGITILAQSKIHRYDDKDEDEEEDDDDHDHDNDEDDQENKPQIAFNTVLGPRASINFVNAEAEHKKKPDKRNVRMSIPTEDTSVQVVQLTFCFNEARLEQDCFSIEKP